MSFCCNPYLHQVKGERSVVVASGKSYLKAKQVKLLFQYDSDTKNEHGFIKFVY